MIKTCRVCRAGALLTIEAIVGRLDAGAQRLDASAGLQTFLAAGYVSEDLRRLSAHLAGPLPLLRRRRAPGRAEAAPGGLAGPCLRGPPARGGRGLPLLLAGARSAAAGARR